VAEGRPKKIALVGATGYQYESIEARVERGSVDLKRRLWWPCLARCILSSKARG
jgi:hypothetical protein